MIPRPYRCRPLEERFWEKVDKNPIDKIATEKGCWLWNGQTKDYGRIYVYGKRALVKCHHLSYEMHKGPIPEGNLIRHTCDIKGCVNPDHLLAGTHKDNMRDAIERGQFVFVKPPTKKTHCKRGHEFTPENIYWNPSGRSKRQCLICLRAGRKARSLKLSAERVARPKKIVLPPTHCKNGHPLTPENIYRWPSKEAKSGWRWCCRICVRRWRSNGRAKHAIAGLAENFMQ